MTSKQRQRADRKLAKRRTFLESLEPRYVLTGFLSLDFTNIGAVDESNTAYEITATRTHFDGADVSQGVSVAFSISLPSMWYPNQATLNEDYTLSSQEFSFAPGEDQAKITLTLIDDNVDEPAELITFINFDPDTMGISVASFGMEIKASDPKANVADVSDPDCCGADSTASYTDNNLETGNIVVRPPRMSLAINDFGPRYSTNEFRPGIYSAETTRRQSPNAPVSIEVNGVFYDPTGVGLNQPYRFSELVEISSLPAGRYDDSLEITEHYASGPSKTYEIPTAILVGGPSNARLSPGWSIPALDRITVTGAGALWQSKSDQLLWFPLDSGNFLRPYGDQDYTTLVDNQDGTHTLANRWGDYQVFNSLGLVTQKVDRDGRTTTFTYIDADSDSELDDISTVDSFDGRTLTYGYTSGVISSITDFDGRVVTLAYDGDDQLESLTYTDPDAGGPANALVTSFTYVTGTSYLETMDDDGDTTEFAYDFAGALISRENPDSSVEEFTNFLTIPLIDPLSGLGTSLNPAPLAMSSDIKGVRVDADNESTQYVLNDLGFVIKSIDADGNETLFERDDFGRVTLQIDPDPDGVGPEASPEAHYEYDIWGNLIQMKLPNGGTRTWNYDLDWHVADESYDERGQMTMRTLDPLTGYVLESRLLFGQPDNLINLETDDIVTEFTYTDTPSDPADPPAGLVERETDPLGNVTYYQYNARGNVISVTYAEGSADEATAYTYYNSDGTVDYELDELSRRTDYSYDDLGRLVNKLLPDPDGGGPLSRPEFEYEYDTRNRVTKETDPLGRETIYTYDSHSRVTKVELPDHDGDSKLTTSTTKYNDLGQVESTKDPLGRETSYEYDKLGRQTKVIMPQVADPITAVHEIQILDFDSGTTGTFKLHGNSKSEVVDLSDLSNLQDVLDSLWGDGNTSVSLTLTEATIRFRGDLSGTNVAEMTVSDISGTLGATPFVSTDKAGVAATLVNPNTQTTYDPLGRLLTSTDALGKVTEYEYTNFGQNLKITLPDPDGVGGQSAPVLYQVFDVSGNLISQTGANGGETTRDYDKLGRLIRVTQPDPDGAGPLRAPVTEYEYDKAGNLRFAFDALGNVTEYQYDDRHRQVKVISPDPDGAGALSELVTQYEFDDAGQLTKVTAPGGRVTEYGYDGLGRLILTTLPDPDGVGGLPRPQTSSTYDAAGRKLTDTDPLSNATSYEYDALDNLVELTQPDPDSGGPLSSPVSLWEYDDAGQLLNTTDPLGNTTSYEYDNLGRTVKVTQPDPDAGGPLAAPITKYEYSLTGNLLKTMDPLKHETVNSYDFLGRRISTTDALGGVTAFTYDVNGNLLTLTDPVDNTTTWVYDTLNRVIQETNELNQHRYFVYDALGNLKRRTDRLGREITFEHDHLNRQTAEEWWDGAAPSIAVTTSTHGSTTNEVQVVGFSTAYLLEAGTFTLTYNSQTTDPIPFDADAATVQAELEALGNLSPGEVLVVKLTDDPSEQEWQITFTGPLAGTNVSQITIDASSVYDGMGAPTDSEGTTTQGAKVNEVQVITLSDTTGGTFTLSFGGQSTAPIAWNASTSTVDSALEALSGAGTVTVSGSAGGPYTIAFTGAYGGVNLAPLIYADNLLTNGDLIRTIAHTFNDDGDLAEVSDPSATYEFVYDGLGRVTNYVQNIAGLTGEIEFESAFDAAGRRTTLQAILDGTDDFQNKYSYDDLLRLSRLIQEEVSGGNAVAEKRIDLGYNAASQYTRLDRYADAAGTEFVASSHYSYDYLNRLQKLVHAETTATPTSGWGSDPLAGYQYTYDVASRILSIDSYIDGLSEYAHDATNQLVGADHNTASDESYEYDANGNRIMSGYSITANNQLQSDGTYNYTYDAEGNRLTRTKISNGYVTRYSWDHRNRLTKVTEEDNASNVLQVTEQSYDAFNQWIRRNLDSDGGGGTAAVDTFFAYENGQIVLHFDGDDAADLSHRYLWGENVDQLFADESVSSLGSVGAVIWPLGDHLGTLYDLVEYDNGINDAAIASHREYDSYGTLISESNSAIDLLFGFTSRPFDESSGLQNNLFRWYDPSAGEWTSEDPIGFEAEDQNLNRYVGNSVLSSTDPSGLVDPDTVDEWGRPIPGRWRPPGNSSSGPAYLPGRRPPARPPQDLRPNFDQGHGPLHYTLFRFTDEVVVSRPDEIDTIVDNIWQGLKTFAHFNGGANNIAHVRFEDWGGFGFGYFDLYGLPGWGSDTFNDDEVAVRVSYNDSIKEVTAVTVGQHQLVGVRKWRIADVEKTGECKYKITIETESFERARNYRNHLGLVMSGENAQKAVWIAYLQNIRKHLQQKFGSTPQGDISAWVVPGGTRDNPWRPGPWRPR